jgi:hypothetical protein
MKQVDETVIVWTSASPIGIGCQFGTSGTLDGRTETTFSGRRVVTLN